MEARSSRRPTPLSVQHPDVPECVEVEIRNQIGRRVDNAELMFWGTKPKIVAHSGPDAIIRVEIPKGAPTDGLVTVDAPGYVPARVNSERIAGWGLHQRATITVHRGPPLGLRALDHAGRPSSGVLVLASMIDAPPESLRVWAYPHATTDEDGWADFGRLLRGTWKFEVRAHRRSTSVTRTIELGGDAPVVLIVERPEIGLHRYASGHVVPRILDDHAPTLLQVEVKGGMTHPVHADGQFFLWSVFEKPEGVRLRTHAAKIAREASRVGEWVTVRPGHHSVSLAW